MIDGQIQPFRAKGLLGVAAVMIALPDLRFMQGEARGSSAAA
jgi:hypothetical protein